MTIVRTMVGSLVVALALAAGCEHSSVGTDEPATRTPVAGRLLAASTLTATGDAGANVASPPTVWVADSSGVVPISGVRVTFTVTGGGGVLGTSSTVTDATGIATAGSWQLGDSAVTNTVVASVPGLPTVTFTATAVFRQVDATFDLQTIGGSSLPWTTSGGGSSVTITGGHYVFYHDGTCAHWWDGFGGREQCLYTVTGQLDGRAAVAFFDAIDGSKFATGVSVDGVMTVSYTDFIDFDTEIYRLAK